MKKFVNPKYLMDKRIMEQEMYLKQVASDEKELRNIRQRKLQTPEPDLTTQHVYLYVWARCFIILNIFSIILNF